jgi:hypothetical protein
MEVFLPGTRLGQFEVVSYPVISDICVDYTCLDHERSRSALLKTLRAELLRSRKARNCFAESGAAWVSLGTHPHIVRCYNLFEPEIGQRSWKLRHPPEVVQLRHDAQRSVSGGPTLARLRTATPRCTLSQAPRHPVLPLSSWHSSRPSPSWGPYHGSAR